MSVMLRCLVPLALGCLTSGCYLTQAARGQFEVMRRSQPIETVLADPATTATTRKGLELTVAARQFAETELALPASRSYRKYADLGRPYVVWNVVATPEFSVEPRRSCFPVAGCVSYRGYFKEATARDHALRLAIKGDDVSVGGVPTYSTLGHLPDPVFNAMLGWRETRLVGTIFHELAHELIYVPGDSEFNEAFASVVEEEGVRRWLARTDGRTAELQVFELANRREAEFAQLLRTTRDRLERLYGSGLDVEALRIEKQREFGRLEFEYERLRKSWGGEPAYDGWFRRSLNNAHLASVATYRDCVPGLRRLLEQGGGLVGFYDRVRALARESQTQRHAAVCEVTPDAGRR